MLKLALDHQGRPGISDSELHRAGRMAGRVRWRSTGRRPWKAAMEMGDSTAEFGGGRPLSIQNKGRVRSHPPFAVRRYPVVADQTSVLPKVAGQSASGHGAGIT